MAHNPELAQEVIEFVQMLKLTDDFFGQPFTLLPWQQQIIWDVYGTVKDNGTRQYTYAYLEIPKKNAKTTMIAGFAVYHLTCDPPGGEIYCCAGDRFQAGLTYNKARDMIDQCPELQGILKVTDSRKEITNKVTGTVLKVLSAEAYTKQGINPTVVIFDELHEQPNRKLWDYMTFGTGATRTQQLFWVITTAGDDPDRQSIGWEIHDKADRLIRGEIQDPNWYAKIYAAPTDADIWDEQVWHMANPSLGAIINIDKVRQEALTAQYNDANERLFRRFRLNQWVTIKAVGWLPLTLFDSTTGDWSPADMVGKQCYLGLDLGSTTDLTGAVLLFPPQGGVDDWRVMFECWIPEAKMIQREERDRVPFRSWVKSKHITATPGDAVDYDFVKSRIITLAKQYEVLCLGADQWNSRMLTQQLEKEEDIEVIEIPQSYAGMTLAMKETERLLRRGSMTHEASPVARWCFGNVRIASDGNENMKPMKNKSIDRIDIMVAWINAMATALLDIGDISVYENRGVLSC